MYRDVERVPTYGLSRCGGEIEKASTMDSTSWCRRKLLVTTEGADSRGSATIEKPFARVGSHEDSEIVLPAKEVRRRSLYLHATDEGIFCIDLTRTDATGYPVRQWLPAKQTVALGPYRIGARLAGVRRPVPHSWCDLLAKGSASGPYPVVSVSVRGGGEIGRRLLTRRLNILGRGRSATMQISSRTVSRFHCALYWEAEKLWVVDLLSAAGTWLEGHCVEVAEFPEGTSLRVGRVEVTFVSLYDEAQVLEEPLIFPDHC
jgi:hypothetical protein